jgi:hypothetical protein
VKKGGRDSLPLFSALSYKHGWNGIVPIQDGVSMRLAYRFFVLAPLAIWPVTGSAISLTNRDAADQKLTVIEGDKQSELVIKAGQKLELCEKSCVIRLPDGEDYEFDGAETVSLEEGLLFLDNPDDQAKAAQ